MHINSPCVHKKAPCVHINTLALHINCFEKSETRRMFYFRFDQ